jgi:mannose-6-phosphate isomerase-like protein (cupin superfamily)
MRKAWLFVALLGCGGETAPPTPPGAVLVPPDAPKHKKMATRTSSATLVDAGSPAVEAVSPITPTFVDLGKTRIDHTACETRATFIVKGKATADKDALAQGDVIVTQGKGGYDLAGEGSALLAVVQPPTCDPAQLPTMTKKIVRGGSVAATKWANGTMIAHLDVEGPAATIAYMGRLEGIAAVAEHMHDSSWEVLCAIEASGTFTLAGAPQKLGPKQCVKVPPKTLHSWTPDPNTKLVAIQLYTPPGPEQRFKAMAAESAKPDAGAKDGGH